MVTVSNLRRLLAIFHALLFVEVSAYQTNAPTVNLGYAKYRGAVDEVANTTIFLGIRYAAAPIRNLRWAAPQPPQKTSGVQDATTQPSECYQFPIPADVSPSKRSIKTAAQKRSVTSTNQSEDCLFLSIYIPGTTVTPVKYGGLPVLVWISGAGYVFGSEGEFNGTNSVVESNHGLIVVTIQYRLGLFGFLAGDAVKSGGALNAGLLDQNYALQWIQSHISEFGGDPAKVTIWGQLAGGGSVLQHIIANGGNTQPPLFRAAMTSSAYLPSQYNYNDSIPESIYQKVVSGTGCTQTPDTLSCLRATDINTLESVNVDIISESFYGTFTFAPVVDGTFITQRPTVALAAGQFNGEALYSVADGYEGMDFVDPSITLNISQYISQLYPNIEASQVAAAVPLFESVGDNFIQAAFVIGESMFVCPTYYLLEAFRSKGKNAWKGHFGVQPQYRTIEQAYVLTNESPEFVTAFSDTLLAMAMFLNPGYKYDTSDVLPDQWNVWSDGDTEMMFNVTSSGLPDLYTFATDSRIQTSCAFWHSIAANTAQ